MASVKYTTAPSTTPAATRLAVSALLAGSLLFAACRAEREPSAFITGANLPWLDGKMGWDIADHAEWGVDSDAGHAHPVPTSRTDRRR